MTVASLSIFLVEETKAPRDKMVPKSRNKLKTELRYDPRSLDISFNVLCIPSLLIKKEKKKRNSTKNHPA